MGKKHSEKNPVKIRAQVDTLLNFQYLIKTILNIKLKNCFRQVKNTFIGTESKASTLINLIICFYLFYS